jgi:hypothetical protein
MSALRPLERLLYWDYDRSSLAYELLCLAMLLFLALAPPGLLGDPIAAPRR